MMPSIKRRAIISDNKFLIRDALWRQGITLADVAAKAGVSTVTVSEVVSGRRTSSKVITALLENGVPRALLALPEDTGDTAA